MAALACASADFCQALTMGGALSQRTLTGRVGRTPPVFLLTPPSHLPSVAPFLSPCSLPGGSSTPFSESSGGLSRVAPATFDQGESVKIRCTSSALHCE